MDCKNTWLRDKPDAYWCPKCKEEFNAVDAVKDFLWDEGELDCCPYCGETELEEVMDGDYDPALDDIEVNREPAPF